MRPQRVQKLTLWLLGGALALALLQTVILLALLVAPPTAGPPAAASSPAPSEPGPVLDKPEAPGPTEREAPQGVSSDLPSFLDQSAAEISRFATEFGVDPATLLPDDAQLVAATNSASSNSPEVQEVLAIFAAAYEQFGMPSPSLPEQGERAPTAPAPQAIPEPQGLPDEGGEADAETLRSYLRLVSERLERLAGEQGRSAELSLPSRADQEAACASGDATDQRCAGVIDKLRQSYELLGAPFPELPG